MATIKWPQSTNKGTALMKLAHQFQVRVILRDEYVGWFFDEAEIEYFKERPLNLEKFMSLAYWYIAISKAVESGCKQILLLGAGYDTRFFRIPSVRDAIAT